MLSPMMAPSDATTSTAAIGNLPSDAMTPPRMTAISPGKTKPTNADASSAGNENTSNSATHGGSVRIASDNAVTTQSRRHLLAADAVGTLEMVTERISVQKVAAEVTATRRHENCVGSGIHAVRVTVF